MIGKKDLTIFERLREMRTLRRTVLCLIDKKYINLALRYMKAISIKDVCVQSSKGGSDIMLNSIIKDEHFDDEINNNLTSYNEHKQIAIEEIKKMIAEKTDEEMIVFFRDELKWKWDDICKVFNYSLRQCHRLYDSIKKIENDT